MEGRRGRPPKAVEQPSRRFISSKVNYCIMEKFDEVKGPGGTFSHYATARGDIHDERDLKKVKFRPGVVAWPFGLDYLNKTVGLFESSDPDEINLVLAAIERAKKNGSPDDIREYPREREAIVKDGGQCKGVLDIGGVAVEG